MKSKRITFILPKRNPNPIGGFKVVYEYANRFANDGFIVNLVFPATLLWKEKDLIPKFKGLLAYPIFKFIKHKYLPTSWFKLNKNINILWTPSLNEKFIPDADYIFATACGTSIYVDGYSSKKGHKFYLIQHKEEWDFSEQRLEYTYKFNMHKIVISDWLHKLMGEISEEATVIKNGLNFNFFKIKNRIDERLSNKILMMYHEASWKGSDIGISVLKKLKTVKPDISCTLFGAYPKPNDLPDFIKYVELPAQEELVDLYNDAAIFLGTSFNEGWGLTVAEAMQCGCAVVCTNINGYNEMVFHNHTGLLSNAGDTVSLTDNVLKLINDDNLRHKIANNGHEFIKQFTWEKSYKKLKNVLLEKSK